VIGSGRLDQPNGLIAVEVRLDFVLPTRQRLVSVLGQGRAALLLAATLFLAVDARGQTSTNDGVFTKEQAARGADVYRNKCAACHLDDLVGADRVPPLVGDAFFEKWIGADVSSFVDRLHSMPANAPASLGENEYVSVAAFLLNANGITPGPHALPTDPAVLKTIRIAKAK
jgi:mono/diheme cytochrome c family protein